MAYVSIKPKPGRIFLPFHFQGIMTNVLAGFGEHSCAYSRICNVRGKNEEDLILKQKEIVWVRFRMQVSWFLGYHNAKLLFICFLGWIPRKRGACATVFFSMVGRALRMHPPIFFAISCFVSHSNSTFFCELIM